MTYEELSNRCTYELKLGIHVFGKSSRVPPIYLKNKKKKLFNSAKCDFFFLN